MTARSPASCLISMRLRTTRYTEPMTSLRFGVWAIANPPRHTSKRVEAMQLITRFGSRKFTGDSSVGYPSSMMMLGFGLLLQRLASQEVLFLLLLAEVFGTFGVVTLHLQALFSG